MTFYLLLSEKDHFSVNFATAGEARGDDDVFWCSKIYCSVIKTEQLSFLPESSYSQLEPEGGGLFFFSSIDFKSKIYTRVFCAQRRTHSCILVITLMSSSIITSISSCVVCMP